MGNGGMIMNRHIRMKFHVKEDCIIPFMGRLNSNREHIAELFQEFGFKVGAEIGVRKGDFSLVILKKNPTIKFYAIDPWNLYARGVSGRRQDRYFEYTKEILSPYNATVIRKNSMEALSDIPDRSLDFIYIDAIHSFDNVMVDLIEWGKKVRPLGIVSGHDYSNLPGMGVIPAVEAYTRGHNIFQWFITSEVNPSYFWVQS